MSGGSVAYWRIMKRVGGEEKGEDIQGMGLRSDENGEWIGWIIRSIDICVPEDLMGRGF